MPIPMRRRALPGTGWQNAGLFFDRGFPTWLEDDGQRGEAIGQHIRDVCGIDVPAIYESAFSRWVALTADEERFAFWCGRLRGRLFIGLGGAHVLETHVTRHHLYGVPLIPGSSLKGLARAAAQGYGLTPEEIDVLFGRQSDDPEENDAGYLIFHDAWWIPGSAESPYVPEIVTVHYQDYYTSQGKTDVHNDLESPNPNHQLAVRGGFYFVVEGKKSWANLGMEILKRALQEEGVGGKVAAGYGYFYESWSLTQSLLQMRDRVLVEREKRLHALREEEKARARANMSESERMMAELRALLDDLEPKTVLSKDEKDQLNRQANRILEAGERWTPQEREAVAERIERCYQKTLKRDKRKKKLKKLKRWIETGKES